MHLEDLACLRQLAYRLFSSILLYPDKGRWKSIAAAAAELSKQTRLTARFAFYPQWRRLLTTLADLGGHSNLGEEYIRVFQHNPGGAACLPYESVYVEPGRQAAGWVMALLEREYATAGLALSPVMNEPPDHVAVELEFMAFLCGQETEAWKMKAAEDATRALKRQAVFLGRHLGLWFPALAERVATTDGKGVYSLVTGTARAFITHDQALIGTLLTRFQGVPDLAQAGASRQRSSTKGPPGSRRAS